MKTLFATALVALCMLFASAGLSAQEMSFRKGVVTGISPIQVAAPQTASGSGGSATGGALGRMFGRALGRAVADATGSYEAYNIANGAVQDLTSGTANNQAGKQVTAYMVIIRFDDGNESAIQSAQVSNLRIGGRVRVFGSGNAAQIVAE